MWYVLALDGGGRESGGVAEIFSLVGCDWLDLLYLARFVRKQKRKS